MALFKKKKREEKAALPPLPQSIPNNPEFPQLSNPMEEGLEIPIPSQKPMVNPPARTIETGSLPIFPNSHLGENLAQEAIKSAVFPPKKMLPTLPPLQQVHSPIPMKRPIQRPSSFPHQEMMPLPPPLPKHNPSQIVQEAKKIQDLYVRIDKFKFALENFKKIQEKISEIESLLRKIKEERKREDEELSNWEREIETIKARMQTIDRNIFSKMG